MGHADGGGHRHRRGTGTGTGTGDAHARGRSRGRVCGPSRQCRRPRRRCSTPDHPPSPRITWMGPGGIGDNGADARLFRVVGVM
ncbi:MAG: hypothetical protein CMH35_09840, partial [Microbacterium sp.]|nr:hypothetical protein [Microbacterium sp.]